MTLSILHVGYPLAPVGKDTAGGAEQVLALLDSALVREGHNSLVVASETSQVTGTLIPIPWTGGMIDDAARERAWEEMRRAIAFALDHWKIDLVHMHGVDFHRYLPPPEVRTLVTLHLPISWYPHSIWQMGRPLTWFNCVSASQQKTCPADARLLPPIPNGVPVDTLQTAVSKQDWAMTLGRICPEKGVHLALDAARRAGVPLLVAGQVYRYPEHERYFNGEIVPRLGPGYSFIGSVGLERKRKLLSEARCLLIPSLVPETSSLVAMEALACGTPVIAFPNGALAEIIEDGKTGFLVHDEQEMADAIRNVSDLDRAVCRATARQRFPAEKTIAKYLEAYQDLVQIQEFKGHSGFTPA